MQKANVKFVTRTKKDPRKDQTKSYKVKCRAKYSEAKLQGKQGTGKTGETITSV